MMKVLHDMMGPLVMSTSHPVLILAQRIAAVLLVLLVPRHQQRREVNSSDKEVMCHAPSKSRVLKLSAHKI